MSSDDRSSSNPPGRRGARRPARTIDLKADEVASSPVADSPSETQDTPQQPAEPAPAAQVIVEEPSTQSIEPVSASPVYSEPPTPETDASGANPPPPPADPSLNDRDSSSGERPLLGLLRLIGAGAVGAALALLAFSLWWGTSNRGGDTSALASRLSQTEQRLAEIAARPSVSGVDPKTVDDLASRVARIEGAVTTPTTSAPDSALTNRLATLEGELRSLEEKIGVVARRSDEIATMAADARSRADAAAALPKAAPPGPPPAERSEVEALANRVATVERTAKAMEAELAKRASEAGEGAVRLAVTAVFLQAAVERGDPFAKELAAAKALGADPKALAPLEPFAENGVPSAAALAQELSALLPTLRQASGAAASDGNFLGRLQANAEKLVRIRPTDETPGDDPNAVLTRAERRAAQSDIAGALAELAKLSPPARAPAQPWIAKAEARQAAIEASRRFAADALVTVAKPTQ